MKYRTVLFDSHCSVDHITCMLCQVDDLKAKLAVQEVELKQKNEDADKLIEVVGVETEKVSKEKVIANDEELKVQVIAKVCGWVGRWQGGCGSVIDMPFSLINSTFPPRTVPAAVTDTMSVFVCL